jgi:ProQ/FINO family.
MSKFERLSYEDCLAVIRRIATEFPEAFRTTPIRLLAISTRGKLLAAGYTAQEVTALALWCSRFDYSLAITKGARRVNLDGSD